MKLPQYGPVNPAEMKWQLAIYMPSEQSFKDAGILKSTEKKSLDSLNVDSNIANQVEKGDEKVEPTSKKEVKSFAVRREQKQPILEAVHFVLHKAEPRPASPPEPLPVPQTSNVPETLMNDSWRSWIAENLILGNRVSELIQVLQEKGISRAVAEKEIELAQQSPYLKGSQRLKNKLKKREWVLSNYQALARLAPLDVPRKEKLTADEFLRDYYMLNRPVIITGMMEDWPALEKWNLETLKSMVPHAKVQVQTGRNSDPQYEINSVKHRQMMTFSDYIELIQQRSPTNDFYMTANNDTQNKESLESLWKDIGPLSEYLEPSENRQGFFWLGPAGTVTPFHHDLTNNFMAQVMGRKKVKIIPAHDITLLPNPRHCFTPLDGLQMGSSSYPVTPESPMVLECILNPGEILFLPIGCWHFVESLDVSITMSFTNFRWNNNFLKEYPSDYDF